MRSPRAILQMEAAECGAACLAMVLSAHGREITLEEARGRCATSRDGVDAGALGVAAESYGLKFKAVRAEPESLKDLPLPAVLHWNFNHFVVLVNAGGGGFWLLDPASGRRKVSKAELSKSFTGLALAIVPGPHFERGGQKASSLGRLIAHARGSWDGMAVVALCGIACVIPGLIISGAIQVFVDHVAGKARFDWLVAVLAALLIAVTAQAGLEYLRARVVANLKSKIGVVIAARGFHRALLLPLAFFAQRSAGELVSRLRIGSEIGGTIVGPVSQLMPSAMMAGCYIAVMALQDPLLGSVVLGISVLSILVLVRLSTRLSEATRLNSVLEGQANGISTAGFAAFDAFRLLGRCDLFESRWLAAEEKAIDAGQRLGTLRLVATIAPGAATLLIVMTVLIIGAARVMHGDLTLGGLLALQVLAGMIGAPVAVIAQSWCAIQEASGAIARLDDLHRYPVDPQFAGDQIAPKIVPVPEGAPLALKLDGIRFGFRADTSVLKDVSLQIAPGEIVALMGPSGAGKSTLAKLAAGMVQPDAGTIYLGGAPLIDWPGHALRAKLQYVPQMAALVTGTLRDNITMWDPAIGDEAIADALEHANAAEFVQRAGGLYAQISAERPCLSGGERQRLALVRALVRQPVILVLDETTSALDTLSEAQVLAGLRRTGAGILLVTHRNGSAARCDRVLALDGAGGFAPRASAVVFAERYGT